jgi:hypothetical protein
MTEKKEFTNEQSYELTLPPDKNSVLHLNREKSVKRAQQILHTYVNKDVSLVDDFIKARREEAAKEEI